MTQHRPSRDASRPILMLPAGEISPLFERLVERLGGDTSELDSVLWLAIRAQP